MDEHELKNGAFAFVDCLGFKGIWDRKPASTVIAKLVQLEEVVAAECAKFGSRDREIGPEVIVASVCSISDGVAVSVRYADCVPAEAQRDGSQLVGRLCMMMPKIIDLFLVDEPHLLLRGCVTYGPHLTHKTFLIGPAVDQAVEYEKIPNGAFIWLAPSASTLYDAFLFALDENYDVLVALAQKLDVSGTSYARDGMDTSMRSMKEIGCMPHVLRNYAMPIKGGKNQVCSVINPLSLHPRTESRVQRMAIFESEMSSDRLDVLVKKENTMAFLAKANTEVSVYADKLRQELEKFG
jgi:hypothetical protein